MERISEILSFWFDVIGEDGLPVEDRARLWFRSDAKTDALVRGMFETDLRKAISGQLAGWEQMPSGRLALILLLDQFSRSIYRGTRTAFSQDEQALALCVAGIDQGHDLALKPMERAFFYLPFQHSERLEMQDRSIKAFETLLHSAPTATTRKLQGFLENAIKHREIIRRFGRFPHRNEILGRASTPQERRFLRSGGSTFGQHYRRG